jgi:sialic acid synthase SpsE
MEIIASVYERASVDFAETIAVDAYKLHNADLTNPHLVRHVASTGKRIDLSVGAATLDEIQDAVGWIGASSPSVWLMYGYQDFPTRVEDVHLRYLMTLRERFGKRVGYQDHTDANLPGAFWIPAAALGLGVDVLEKHITHDRSTRGADHQAALNPDEFARFVEMVREVERALGVAEPRPFSEAEERYRKYARKSIVAARDLSAGERLTDGDLVFLRTGELGLPPSERDNLVARAVKRPIAKFELISAADVE